MDMVWLALVAAFFAGSLAVIRLLIRLQEGASSWTQ